MKMQQHPPKNNRGRITRFQSIRPVLFLLLLGTVFIVADAFIGQQRSILPTRHGHDSSVLVPRVAKGFGVVEKEKKATTTTTTSTTAEQQREEEDLAKVATLEVKRRLLDLLPRMMGTPEEFKQVESYINILEDRYQPVQTLDFLNLAMEGDWQLLFSTNLSAGPKPHFRIKEMYQRVRTDKLEGSIQNCVAWDLAEDHPLDDGGSSGGTFDASGTMTVKCSYKINQGARMVVDLEDHVLELAKGSVVPKDVEGLVGLIHRTMPKELFDPNEHAMDTTYLDVDLRLVRLTGPRFEGIRNVFVRRGSMEINPV